MELTLHDAQVAYAELLVEIGVVELDAMNDWLTSLTETPIDIAQGVCEAGLISEFELTRRVAAHADLPVASDIELDMYASLNPHIMRELCVELFMVPMSDAREDPFPIALTNPLDEEGLAFICEQVGVSALKIHLAEPSHIYNEIFACYGTEEQWASHLAELRAEEASASSEPLREGIHATGHHPSERSLSHQSNVDTDDEPVELNVAPPQAEREVRSSTLPDWSMHDESERAGYDALRRTLSV